jgi:hypothetical protein
MRQTFPDLQAPITFPLTRMLLRSDGSTTLLLEALLGVSLRLRVDSQLRMTLHEVDVRVRRALGLSDVNGEGPLVLRRSRLTLPDGGEVSINRVLFQPGPTAWSGDQHDDVPLGLQLHAREALQRRRLLSAGIDRWPENPDRPCAYKEYLIHTGEDTPYYVHERFNPHVIPVD